MEPRGMSVIDLIKQYQQSPEYEIDYSKRSLTESCEWKCVWCTTRFKQTPKIRFHSNSMFPHVSCPNNECHIANFKPHNPKQIYECPEMQTTEIDYLANLCVQQFYKSGKTKMFGDVWDQLTFPSQYVLASTIVAINEDAFTAFWIHLTKMQRNRLPIKQWKKVLNQTLFEQFIQPTLEIIDICNTTQHFFDFYFLKKCTNDSAQKTGFYEGSDSKKDYYSHTLPSIHVEYLDGMYHGKCVTFAGRYYKYGSSLGSGYGIKYRVCWYANQDNPPIKDALRNFSQNLHVSLVESLSIYKRGERTGRRIRYSSNWRTVIATDDTGKTFSVDYTPPRERFGLGGFIENHFHGLENFKKYQYMKHQLQRSDIVFIDDCIVPEPIIWKYFNECWESIIQGKRFNWKSVAFETYPKTIPSSVLRDTLKKAECIYFIYRVDQVGLMFGYGFYKASEKQFMDRLIEMLKSKTSSSIIDYIIVDPSDKYTIRNIESSFRIDKYTNLFPVFCYCDNSEGWYDISSRKRYTGCMSYATKTNGMQRLCDTCYIPDDPNHAPGCFWKKLHKPNQLWIPRTYPQSSQPRCLFRGSESNIISFPDTYFEYISHLPIVFKLSFPFTLQHRSQIEEIVGWLDIYLNKEGCYPDDDLKSQLYRAALRIKSTFISRARQQYLGKTVPQNLSLTCVWCTANHIKITASDICLFELIGTGPDYPWIQSNASNVDENVNLKTLKTLKSRETK